MFEVNGVCAKERHFFWKRLFDIVFSSLVLLFLSPLFLLIALLVYVDSRGPIFYSQPRVGRGGRVFPCYKFRSMVVDADCMLDHLLKVRSDLANEWLLRRKLGDDPRVTRVGSFLRTTCLDELPQFWNVLRGDLSVVGPRAVVWEEIVSYWGKRAAKILTVRPGLTGLWQVSARAAGTYETRLHLEETYVDRRNFFLDVLLILRTLPMVVFSRGGY